MVLPHNLFCRKAKRSRYTSQEIYRGREVYSMNSSLGFVDRKKKELAYIIASRKASIIKRGLDTSFFV
jgi:hypothetical protein